jgi:hypothetical protein
LGIGSECSGSGETMTEGKKKRKPGAGRKPTGRNRVQWRFYLDRTTIEQLSLIDKKVIEEHLLKLILSIE